MSQTPRGESVAIVGGGPAGLMAADVISAAGIPVHLYESKPSIGRKFLIAGKGGLNLTHNESYEDFVRRFGSRCSEVAPLLERFGPKEVRKWCRGLGVETFVGGSNRVFPSDMKAFPLLRNWLQRLQSQGVEIHTRHRWLGWDSAGKMSFDSAEGRYCVSSTATILALGGGSWSKLGSDGRWVEVLRQEGIGVQSLQPTNCGFDVLWSEYFRSRFAGQPLKSVILRFTDSRGNVFERRGSCVVTEYGLEGSLIYAASPLLREEINACGTARIVLDLAPDRTLENLQERLCAQRGSRSLSNHLRSRVNIKGVEAALLRECQLSTNTPSHRAEEWNNANALAHLIKSCPVRLESPRPLDEAISTAGGVLFEDLDERLMLKSRPGCFVAGEMLDWEAPTGGYLLTMCLSSGFAAGHATMDWLNRRVMEG